MERGVQRKGWRCENKREREGNKSGGVSKERKGQRFRVSFRWDSGKRNREWAEDVGRIWRVTGLE